MIYIFDANLLNEKSVFVELQKIYGVNKFYSLIICKKLGASKVFKINNLTNWQKKKIIDIILKFNNLLVSQELKQKIENDKKKKNRN